MIKKILLILATIPAILVMLITAVAARVANDFDTESIEFLVSYLSEFQGSNGMLELVSSEAGILFVLHQINGYSHWIMTACIIWIVVILFFLMNKRRIKGGKRKQKI